jgi:amidase
MKALYEHAATELAALIAGGEVSAREAVDAHLARIDEVNGTVNAVTVVLRESALEAADKADASARSARAGGAGARARTDAGLGPLHGVPFTIKENIDFMGTPTTHGIPALRDKMPYRDAPVVERMKAAGALPIARTNLSEFALRLDTDNPLHGRTYNPWDRSVTAGGSSGGDAAALATGMTPLGLGNDLGGSVRNPAFCCGVAALKPTTGRIPRASSIPPLDFGFALQYMAVDGPLARTVGDLRLALSVLAGRDPRDPRSVEAPLRGAAPPVHRAALVLELPGITIAPEIVAAIQQAGKSLAHDGWEVELAAPPELDLVRRTWAELFTSDFCPTLPTLKPVLSPPMYAYMERFCAAGSRRKRRRDSDSHAMRSFLIRVWSEFFVEYPVVVGPTWTRLQWPTDADLDPESGERTLDETVGFITPANVLGLPAVAVPTGVANGLPTGVQVYADLWREDLCLDAAETIESGVERLTPIDPAKDPRR